MKIGKATFERLYPDLAHLYEHFITPPPAGISDEDFTNKYMSSKLWRLNNLYYVINKQGEKVLFQMNAAQHIVYAASRVHPRLLILKSRQQGISTFWLVCYFDDALFIPNLSIGLMAQGTDEAATLLERTKILWDNLHPRIKWLRRLELDKDNLKEYSFQNRSKIFIRVSFRSTTLQRLHVSEMGKIANHYPQRAKEVKTGTLQALGRGMTGVIESTAEGKNMFKEMWDEAVLNEQRGVPLAAKDFKPVFLSWLDDPDCNEHVDQPVDEAAQDYFTKLQEKTGRVLTKQQQNFWIVQRRELGGDIFQEYPATPEEAFTASRDGTFYNRLYQELIVARGRVIPKLYDTNLATDVFFDLGVDDYFVVTFVQHWTDGVRIVKELWGDGKSLQYWLDRVVETGIPIRYWVFPHDVAVRELSSRGSNGATLTREQIARRHLHLEHQITATIMVGDKPSIADGIESVKALIKDMYIDPDCSYLVSCLQNYSKKFDLKLNVWTNEPVHDVYSHGADTFRLIAQFKRKLYSVTAMQRTNRGAAI